MGGFLRIRPIPQLMRMKVADDLDQKLHLRKSTPIAFPKISYESGARFAASLPEGGQRSDAIRRQGFRRVA